jgi:hypothetical protein
MSTGRWNVLSAMCGLLLLALAASGARTSCVPIEPEEPSCPGENPQGCAATGCPAGELCLLTSGVCVPSACDCDAASGQWICTEDCGGGRCVAAGDVCLGPNPQGCASTGCPAGEQCVHPAGVCTPSACHCAPETGTWICTRDCGGGICRRVEEPACRGENPAGCVSTGCPAGEVCVQAAGVCVPSACGCDAATGTWVCTADCSGGICVPAR